MKIYGHPMSTCTRKVLTVLAEKGKEAPLVLVDLQKGEQKQPAHLARQPFGVIPVFEEDDGFQIYESRAIMRYLDRTIPGNSLTPADPKAYARMEQYISVEQSYFSPAAMKIVMERVFKGGGDDATVAKGREGLQKPFEVVDSVLSNQQFLAGNAFTLADISWAPYMEYLMMAGEKDLIGKYKNVAAWWERVSNRASWKKATGR